ncbi:MAG: DUF4198 domain-containing protein [Bacteroidetes bacterium]|nr:DUF4198 domain-containing protein [Bacteroidota bacterium]
MKRVFLLVTVCSAVSLFVDAHEFWLRPRKFRFKTGEELKVDFVVGEQFTGEYWDLQKHKVEKLILFAGGMQKNMVKDVRLSKGNNIVTKLEKGGTYLVALESDDAYLELDAEKFNAYLKEDGIEDILSERTQQKTLDQPSKEYYKRYAKLLVQTGTAADDTYRKRADFRFEIVPLANPYALKVGDYLQCRLYWNGRPSAHTMMKVWSHVGNRIFLQNIYSEDDGTITFPLSSGGPWMVSSVKMVHAEKPGADYQSYWTSLVFGIEEGE